MAGRMPEDSPFGGDAAVKLSSPEERFAIAAISPYKQTANTLFCNRILKAKAGTIMGEVLVLNHYDILETDLPLFITANDRNKSAGFMHQLLNHSGCEGEGKQELFGQGKKCHWG